MTPSPLKFANDPVGYFDEDLAAWAAAERAVAEVEAERELHIIGSV